MSIEMMTYPRVLLLVFATLFVVTFLTLLTVRRRLTAQDGELRRLMSLIAVREVNDGSEPELPGAIESLGETLARLSQRVEAIGRQQATVVRNGSLDEAAAMARAGNSATEIASRAGISVGEAELLLRVQAAGNEKD